MKTLAIFGVSALMSLISSAVMAKLYVWPRLRILRREQALFPLVAPHMFLRFIGLSFLVPGVVSPLLPAAFAVPAAYGDLVAGILAVIAAIGLAKHSSWAIPGVLLFNVWGRPTSYLGSTRARMSRFILRRWALRSTFQRQSCRPCS